MGIQQFLNDWWFVLVPLYPALALFFLPLVVRVITLASAAIAVTGVLAFFAWRRRWCLGESMKKRHPVVALPDGTMVDGESRNPEASTTA